MLTVRVIPCLDVRDGRVVKGVRFGGLRDVGDPAAFAARYEGEGADELVILDVSATPEGRRTAAGTVARVRNAISLPLTVGGGVRTVDDAVRLLEAGADKVAVNTAAVQRPELVSELAGRFGRQCVVGSIDAKQLNGGFRVVTHSGKRDCGLDAVDWARSLAVMGAGEILLTSWDRDGTRSGYDTDLLQAVAGAVRVPVVASGGASDPSHLAEAAHAGASAVLAASMFHDRDFSIGAAKDLLRSEGVEVRL